VNKDYGGIVSAADPTGLLPVWDKYIDHANENLRLSVQPARPLPICCAATGRAATPAARWLRHQQRRLGHQLSLEVPWLVPTGWEAENLIAADAAKAGIKITPAHPQTQWSQ